MSDRPNRRSFLKTVIPIACMAGNAYSANFAEREKLSKIGLQLYTVRKELGKDFAGTLRKVAAIGYKEVEFAGYFNNSPKDIKTFLKANSLGAPSAHISLKDIRENLDKTIESASIINHKYLICGYLSAEDRKSLDDYKNLSALFNRAGEKCKRAGIQFGYHNHDFEFAMTDDASPYDVLLKETDANLVKMELDLYWIAKAGRDPLKYFAENPNRFALLHVKDMDATPKKDFTEVGRGVINFREVFAQAKKAGIKHYFVEQDETPASPFESIKTSYDFLKNLNF
jgi:sugar phosphate isomerase/epimerase